MAKKTNYAQHSLFVWIGVGLIIGFLGGYLGAGFKYKAETTLLKLMVSEQANALTSCKLSTTPKSTTQGTMTAK